MYYAQLNEQEICVAVTQTAGSFNQPNMIEIDDLDPSLLGKQYNWETEAFEVAA